LLTRLLIVEKPPAPWVVRAQELKMTKVVSIDAEEEVRRLKDDILERATQIKLRVRAMTSLSQLQY